MLRMLAGRMKRMMLRRAVRSNAGYWTDVNVTHHTRFHNVEESLAYLDWRNDQYPGYIDLMPVAGQDDKVVLDYGCGPGHDLVGFGHDSRPSRLVGIDISLSSLREAGARLALHRTEADLLHIREERLPLPLEDRSVDYIHSSGVIHHTQDPVHVLGEFRRILRPDGVCRIMVYNYDSVWLHLYVAYVKKVLEGRYAGLDVRSAFRHTTDGEDCPISRVYKPAEFEALARQCGFACRFLGAAVSLFELSQLHHRCAAIMNRMLPAEHRKFLLGLTFDPHGWPMCGDHCADIDGCYELNPI